MHKLCELMQPTWKDLPIFWIVAQLLFGLLRQKLLGN